MTENFITLQVSDSIYWGYKYKITKLHLLNTSKGELIDEVKKDMERFFNSNNLLELAENIYNLKLCFCDTILDGNKKLYYLCSHL